MGYPRLRCAKAARLLQSLGSRPTAKLTLGYRRQPIPATQGVALLIEGEDGARAALLVDAIQGQRQVVIKSLEANYRQVAGVAAATILGDGRVALILDVDAVIANTQEMMGSGVSEAA